MKTKSKIKKQIYRKKNPEVIKTIIFAKKNKNWFRIAEILSGSRKKRANLNLEEINKKTKQEEIVVIPGKVLSQGEIDKKINVVALGFSEKAKEKLLKSKCEISNIIQEIKKNPDAKGIKILRWKS